MISTYVEMIPSVQVLAVGLAGDLHVCGDDPDGEDDDDKSET